MTQIPPAGWYPQGDQQRYWDGEKWTEHSAALAPVVQQPVYVRPTTMVTKSPKRTSHTFHLIMTILTAGVWGIFVWIPLTILHKFQSEKSVSHYR